VVSSLTILRSSVDFLKVRIFPEEQSVQVAGNSVCGLVSTLGPGALRLARICAYQNRFVSKVRPLESTYLVTVHSRSVLSDYLPGSNRP
jgi:hypothetical protein